MKRGFSCAFCKGEPLSVDEVTVVVVGVGVGWVVESTEEWWWWWWVVRRLRCGSLLLHLG